MIEPVSSSELEEIKALQIGSAPVPLFTPELDIKTLIWISKQTAGNILEIGCNEGITTCYLANAFPNRIVYGLDCQTPPNLNAAQVKEIPKDIGAHAHEKSNVRIIESDFETCDLGLFKDIGFCFIDSNHTYEGVKIATERAIALFGLRLSVGIAWHDFNKLDYEPQNPWVGVGRYLRTELSNWPIKIVPGTSIAFVLL